MHQMSTGELYNWKRTVNELKYMLITAIIAKAIAPNHVGGGADDDPESTQYLLYVSMLRILMEQNAVYSAQDLLALLKSPTAAQSQLQTLFDASDGLLTGDNNKVVQGGKYIGKTKLEMRIIKLMPIYKNLFENFISPDIKSKEKFIRGNAGYMWQGVDAGVDAYNYGGTVEMRKDLKIYSNFGSENYNSQPKKQLQPF